MLSRYILRLSAFGRRTAFIDAGLYRARSHTYADTLERAKCVAAWLRREGMAGRPVVMWARPCADWAVAFYGCVLAGAIAVPIDAGFSAEFVAAVQEQTGATLVLGDDTFPSFASLPAAPDFQAFAAARDDVAEIVFTSGTTSEPRGVKITHGNLLANLEPVEREIDRYRWLARPFSPLGFVNLIPLSHLFGQVMGLFIPQLLGGTVVFSEGQTPPAIASAIRKHRASVMVAVPQQLDLLAAWTKLPPPEPRGSILARWWRHRAVHRALGWRMWAFVVGGAPLAPATERFWSALGYAVIQGYGLTETAPAVAITHPFRKQSVRKQSGAVGILLAGVETQIASDGEILVRGPNVSPSAVTDAEGWLHTGDLGRLDEQGNLYYIGRKKDVIVTAAGLNVYPEDVERALTSEPGLGEAAVVARESGGRSLVHAVLAQVSAPDLPAAIDRVNGRLEAHQRIQEFSIWPEAELPRTVSTKKVRRGAIAEWVNGRSLAAPMPEPEPILADSGLTSLDRVEQWIRLEARTGVTAASPAIPASMEPTPIGPTPIEPSWPRQLPARTLRAVFRPLVLFPLLRWYVKVELHGQENLDGLAGPLLFAANHQSYMDVPVILRALPRKWRASLSPAMAPDNFPTATRLTLTRLCFNGFLLSPAPEAVHGALRHAGRLAESGSSILIFPEGRRTPDGRIHEFRAGAGLMAEQLGMTVVPLQIEGLYEVWLADRYQPDRQANRTVHVTIGRPILKQPHESPAEFVTRLRSWFEN